MSVYKDATRNSWYVKIRYTDYYGKKKPQIHKNNYNINLVESYFFLEQYFEKHRPKQRLF